MHISRIELENVKSYASRIFDFARGTTAITGENGAGKTTLIESIAWVLFDLLEYKKDDFVRRGEKKGSVRLTLVSGLDEREYIVFRDTASSYHVTDPQLGVRLADKKEEVTRFLWQHLGLEPGTDLRSLFRQAIGVPQGTFTAIFLEGYAEKKAAFDRLLKVEEYRQAAEKLRDTTRYLEASIGGIRESIARAEGELSRSKEVAEEQARLAQQVASLGVEIEKIEAELTVEEHRVKEFDEKERRLAGLRSAVDRSRADHEKRQLIYTQAERALARSTDARGKLEAARSQHEQHLLALEQLRSLESQRLVHDRIKSEIATNDANGAVVAAEKKRLELDLERLESQERNVASLRGKANEQVAIEKHIDDLKTERAAARSSDERIESIERELGRLRDKYQSTRIKLNDAAARSPQQEIAELLELHTELVSSYSDRRTEIEAEGAELRAKKAFLEARIQRLSALELQMSQAKANLSRLGDPAAQIRILEKDLLRRPAVRSQVAEVETRLEQLANERSELDRQIAEFRHFDKEWAKLSDERDRTAAAHRTFLANENEAEVFAKRKDELADADRWVAESSESVTIAERDLAGAGVDYEPKQHEAARIQLRNAERRAAEKRAAFGLAQQREKQLAEDLSRLTEVRRQLAQDLRERERLENVAETTGFIRDTLKEAAPQVARNYVYRVSAEANQLFREITGDADRSLRWGEDYSITLEEGGFERPFTSLSGGEQMSAALSVRLALLKQLSDIRIAFFDEPTTNMDAERRENFAAQIGRVKNFDQLFVISHDETFDEYVDHHIHVERERRI